MPRPLAPAHPEGPEVGPAPPSFESAAATTVPVAPEATVSSADPVPEIERARAKDAASPKQGDAGARDGEISATSPPDAAVAQAWQEPTPWRNEAATKAEEPIEAAGIGGESGRAASPDEAENWAAQGDRARLSIMEEPLAVGEPFGIVQERPASGPHDHPTIGVNASDDPVGPKFIPVPAREVARVPPARRGSRRERTVRNTARESLAPMAGVRPAEGTTASVSVGQPTSQEATSPDTRAAASPSDTTVPESSNEPDQAGMAASRGDKAQDDRAVGEPLKTTKHRRAWTPREAAPARAAQASLLSTRADRQDSIRKAPNASRRRSAQRRFSRGSAASGDSDLLYEVIRFDAGRTRFRRQTRR